MDKLDLSQAVRDGKPLVQKTESVQENNTDVKSEQHEVQDEKSEGQGVQAESGQGQEGQQVEGQTSVLESSSEQPKPDSDPIWKTLGYEQKDQFLESFNQMKELNKKLEEDPFAKRLLETYEQGQLEKYLEVKSKDWDKLTDEQVYKYKLKEDNPTMSDEALDRLFQNKFKSLFDEDADEADSKLDKELLTAEAAKVRDAQKKIQQEWEVPDVQAKRAEQQKQQEEQMKEQIAQFHRMVDEAPETKSLAEGIKTVEDQTIAVENPEELVTLAKDANAFYRLFAKDGGGIDFDRFYRVANYARNPQRVEEIQYKLGYEAGKAAIIQQYQNVEAPVTNVPEKSGPIDPKKDKKGFLQEALSTKRSVLR